MDIIRLHNQEHNYDNLNGLRLFFFSHRHPENIYNYHNFYGFATNQHLITVVTNQTHIDITSNNVISICAKNMVYVKGFIVICPYKDILCLEVEFENLQTWKRNQTINIDVRKYFDIAINFITEPSISRNDIHNLMKQLTND